MTRDGKRTTRRRISGPRKVAEIKFPAVERHSSPRWVGEGARARVVHRRAFDGTPLIRISLEFNEETGTRRFDFSGER